MWNKRSSGSACIRLMALVLATLMLLSVTVFATACADTSEKESDTEAATEEKATVNDGDATANNDDATANDSETAGNDGDATEGDGDATEGDGDATEGDGDATEGDGDATGGDIEVEDYSKRTAYDDMAKTKYQKEFVILTRDELSNDFKMDEDDGDPSMLDELLIARNKVIEQDFAVTLDIHKGGDYTAVNETVHTQYMSALDDYDVAIGQKYSFTTCVVNNYLMDLNTVSAMSLDEAWWDQGCNKNLAIQGKNYVASGDIQPSAMLISSCFAFNKKMMNELGKEEPYDLVREYKWTLDVFNDYTTDITTDMNGDGEMDYDADRYGLSSWMMDIPFSVFYGAGGMLAALDEDGKPVLEYEQADVVNRYEKIFRGIIRQNAYFVTDPTLYETSYECFAGGHALFYDTTLNKIKNFLSEMDDDYGVVPVPMYDEMQKEYKSFVNGATGFIMINATEKDPEYVGTILDAMARYNYQNVSPNLFEVISKLQSVRDEDSSEMVEYIIRNRVYDLAYFFDLDISNVVLNQLKEGKEEITSALKSANKSSSKALTKILKGMNKT